MEAVIIITVLALLQYVYFGYQVGAMRGQTGVKAPAIQSGRQVLVQFILSADSSTAPLIARTRAAVRSDSQCRCCRARLWQAGYSSSP